MSTPAIIYLVLVIMQLFYMWVRYCLDVNVDAPVDTLSIIMICLLLLWGGFFDPPHKEVDCSTDDVVVAIPNGYHLEKIQTNIKDLDSGI